MWGKQCRWPRGRRPSGLREVASDAELAESVTVAAPKGVLVQGGTQVTVSAEKVLITATTEIMLAVGTSVLTLSPTGITISAPKIASTAIGMHDVQGSLIEI